MRVIAGKFKGRRLFGPKGLELRPTSDRLKETLFDIIGPDVGDAVFLDVFAGTGAIGIEALSRGARNVVSIEKYQSGVIEKNLRLCEIEKEYMLLESDVFFALRTLARQQFHPDFVFLDPPYDWEHYRDLLDILFRQQIAIGGARVIVEHHRKADLPQSGDGYRLLRTVRQGDHCLSFFHPGDE